MRQYKTVRGLLSSPERWTKGNLARDAQGESTSCRGKNAACFCLLGAVNRIAGRNSNFYSDARKRLQEAIFTLFPKMATRRGWAEASQVVVAQFNDAPHRTFADIQKVVKAAKI